MLHEKNSNRVSMIFCELPHPSQFLGLCSKFAISYLGSIRNSTTWKMANFKAFCLNFSSSKNPDIGRSVQLSCHLVVIHADSKNQCQKTQKNMASIFWRVKPKKKSFIHDFLSMSHKKPKTLEGQYNIIYTFFQDNS